MSALVDVIAEVKLSSIPYSCRASIYLYRWPKETRFDEIVHQQRDFTLSQQNK